MKTVKSSPIEVEVVIGSDKNRYLRMSQIVTTTYSGGSQGFGDTLSLGGEEHESERSAIQKIGETMSDEAAIEAAENTLKEDSRIFRILSMNPIFDESYAEWLQGLSKTERSEKIANLRKKQVVLDNAGQPVLYKGKPFYKANFLSIDGKAPDQDWRQAELDAVDASKKVEDVDMVEKEEVEKVEIDNSPSNSGS